MLPVVAAAPAVLEAARGVGPVVLRGMVQCGPMLLLACSAYRDRRTITLAVADRVRQPGTRVQWSSDSESMQLVIEPASPEITTRANPPARPRGHLA